ncbi:MAG: uncharacterized membrane protein YhaH (DUF805 family) [Alphaproteobacteria bacterium]|jgi:uncharacterized membrane protein YhaH (DUF805 family)
MYFLEAVKVCFCKSFVFKGRASRAEYWLFYAFQWFISFLLIFLSILMMAMSGTQDVQVGNTGINSLLFISYLVLLTPNIAVSVRRLHDTNRSGWWFWLNLLPIIGQLIFLNWLMKPSDNAVNNYGDVPEK